MKSEHIEQKQVCNYLKAKGKLFFSVPNGFIAGGRNKFGMLNKMKSEGYKTGVPDLFIPEPNNNYSGLFIEMKTVSGGTVSKDQKQWLADLNKKGYLAVICKGFDHAKEQIDLYFS